MRSGVHELRNIIIIKHRIKKQISQTKEFHKAFGLFHTSKVGRDEIPQDVRKVRAKLLREEVEEVISAMENEPIENIAKELADLEYVLLGTVIGYGLGDKFDEVFSEVHNSNMSKLDEDGNPIVREDGKILKSNKYKEADIKTILKK